MCVKLRGSGMTPGQIMAFMTGAGKASGIWGFSYGKQANVRGESLRTVWKEWKDNTGILLADSFWEKDKQFVRPDSKPFNIAVIYNDHSEFAVITTPAIGLVKKYHGRMPLIIRDDHADNFLFDSEDFEPIGEELIVLKEAV